MIKRLLTKYNVVGQVRSLLLPEYFRFQFLLSMEGQQLTISIKVCISLAERMTFQF